MLDWFHDDIMTWRHCLHNWLTLSAAQRISDTELWLFFYIGPDSLLDKQSSSQWNEVLNSHVKFTLKEWDGRCCEVSCGGHQRKDNHRVSSCWSSISMSSIIGLCVREYEQIPIMFGTWPFWLTFVKCFSLLNAISQQSINRSIHCSVNHLIT